MPEPLEVAIQKALTDRAKAFATAQSIPIALPFVDFTPPPDKSGSPVSYGKWLRMTFLPNPTQSPGLTDNSTDRHYGILQIDVFYGLGGGEYAPGRIAAAIIEYFNGTPIFDDSGRRISILRRPAKGPSLKDDPWVQIPVSIVYQCFARPS